MTYVEDDVDELVFDVSERALNPDMPTGGRAAFGTATGLAVATIVASAWARLEYGIWNPAEVNQHGFRIGIAGLSLIGATVGAALLSPAATRRGAVVGTAIGTLAAHVPLVWDPFLVKRHPVLGNLWQYGIPVASAVIGANAVG